MSPLMDTTYFTCTLGQAKLINGDRKQISNINSLIDAKASEIPDQYVVGFATLTNQHKTPGEARCQKYNFRQIQRGTCYVARLAAKILNSKFTTPPQRQTTVALLCPSTPEFLFTWLGLIRLGCAVLLIAPQCQPAAIAHLCKICGVHTIFYDETYEELAQESRKDAGLEKEHDLDCVPLMFSTTSNEFINALEEDIDRDTTASEASENTIAYLFHTSGTSTGLPKPIPQSHRAGVGVLPQYLDGSRHATFTTTPLYHGGIADLFRSWTSNAMIWLFPGKGVPITAKNVVSCLEIAEEETDTVHVAPVKYFTSVPYIQQMMASDARGLQFLRDMDIVGVGGAALPQEVGDDLVSKGVNLVSRFGSAECGFLLSSHRDYGTDREWQYLRSSTGADELRFEARDDGLSELIVFDGWPHRAKTNRPDNSFATADLFSPHSSLPSAWKYNSRSDSQLTLITGKKFDPAPLEDSIATSPLLSDVLIFGNGRPFAGALLFRSSAAAELSDDELITRIAPAVEILNRKSQDHARLARNMLVPVGYGENRLQKSSKGTVLRNKAEETYREMIEGAYSALTASLGDEVVDEDVAEVIKERIETMMGRGRVKVKGKSEGKAEDADGTLALDTDLFSYGIDSVASIQIRYTLQQLLPPDSPDLPLSIVEDCGTVSKLADFVIRLRNGQDPAGGNSEDELKLMQELVDQYGDFSEFAENTSSGSPLTNGNHEENDGCAGTSRGTEEGQVIVLMGATGALGAHVLHLYRNDPSVKQIYCLVRGADTHAARERVHKSLIQRGLPGLHASTSDNNIPEDASTTSPSTSPCIITVFPAKLSEPHLGLSDSEYKHIAATATSISHLAWAVNFRLRLRSFVKDHILGVRHLILLALAAPGRSSPPTLAFCSSVASVSAWKVTATGTDSDVVPITVPETPSPSPLTASPLGYSRSKWVAEALLHRAYTQIPRLRHTNALAVLRVGQLSGDSHKGVWNANEAWPMLLGSVRATGALPRLEGETLSWLPGDVAAKGWVEVVRALRKGTCRDDDKGDGQKCGVDEIPVFHVLNPSLTPTWSDLLSFLKNSAGITFDTVPPTEWIHRLEALRQEKPQHPALRLLGMWRESYGGMEGDSGNDNGDRDVSPKNVSSGVLPKSVSNDVENELERSEKAEYEKADDAVVFDTRRAKEASPALAAVGPLDEVYLGKMWRWIVENVEE